MNLKEIINGKVQTRSGDKVRIYSINNEPERYSNEFIHGAVYYGGQWHLMGWGEDGRFMKTDSVHDLVLIRPPSRWINVYEPYLNYNCSYMHSSRETADNNQVRSCKRTRIACIEFKEGDGL